MSVDEDKNLNQIPIKHRIFGSLLVIFIYATIVYMLCVVALGLRGWPLIIGSGVIVFFIWLGFLIQFGKRH